jgi:hypothetical protein
MLTGALWLAQYAVLTAFSLAGHYPHPVDAGLRRLLTTAFGILLCVAMGRLLDRAPDEPAGRRWARALSMAVAASALWSLFAYAVTHLAPAEPPTGVGRIGVLRELALNAVALLGLFVAWACGALAIGYKDALAEGIRRPAGAVPPGRAVLWVRTGRGETRLALDTVERFAAERDYVRIHARSGEHLVHGGLRSLCEALEPDRFLQVHRSFVVNLAEIVRVERRRGGPLRLVLASGACVPVGRTYRKAVRERLLALQRPCGAYPGDGD